jgi:hypothetical protein
MSPRQNMLTPCADNQFASGGSGLTAPARVPAGPGAKTVVITDSGGDGPGPRAAVIPGGGPPPL